MLYVFSVECRDKMLKNKRYNAYSVVATHGKRPRVDCAFACQPWAIKGTTLTALPPRLIQSEYLLHGGGAISIVLSLINQYKIMV